MSVLLLAALLVQAPAAQNATPRPGFRAAPPIFQQNCGTCHDGKQAPSITDLQSYSPEQVYAALTTGKMKDQAAQISDVQKRQIAEFLAARPMGSDEAGDIRKMSNPCPTNPAMSDPSAGPSWNGWSPSDKNARFQTAAAAGLTAAKVPTLKLKWAFGVPKAAEMHSQPTIAAGRVFFGSDAGYIYSLDAKTGCVYWAFHADSGTRTAPTIASIQGQGSTKYAVYFVDVLTRAYALDAQTGKLLWKTRAGAHPRAKSTGSATVYNGRMYVPMSAMETTTGAVLTYECCTFRGHVTALDANTGRKLWTTFVIPDEPKPRGKNKEGVTLYGPAGASVWNPPTVDPKRHRIYVGTGNGVAEPTSDGSDSIIAMDMDTGKIVWQHQEYRGDVFINNCRATGDPGDNCPQKLGPDYDFGGSALIMHTLPDGRDVIIAGSKGGVALALDLDKNGAIVWRTNIAERPPGAAGLIVFGGASDGENVYYGLNQPGGGIAAVKLSDGSRPWTAKLGTVGPGNPAATSAIPGVVFTSSADGMLRALSTIDGKVLWEYATAREYESVNGVPTKGGNIGQAGATVAGGMVFIGSGYGTGNGGFGNALLAFGLE
jgi:polyvinyl alcohol dehydrogenase (cytochrome)